MMQLHYSPIAFSLEIVLAEIVLAFPLVCRLGDLVRMDE